MLAKSLSLIQNWTTIVHHLQHRSDANCNMASYQLQHGSVLLLILFKSDPLSIIASCYFWKKKNE